MWGWMWPRLSIFSPWSSPSCRIAVGICEIDFSRPQLTFLIGISFAKKKSQSKPFHSENNLFFLPRTCDINQPLYCDCNFLSHFGTQLPSRVGFRWKKHQLLSIKASPYRSKSISNRSHFLWNDVVWHFSVLSTVSKTSHSILALFSWRKRKFKFIFPWTGNPAARRITQVELPQKAQRRRAAYYDDSSAAAAPQQVMNKFITFYLVWQSGGLLSRWCRTVNKINRAGHEIQTYTHHQPPGYHDWLCVTPSGVNSLCFSRFIFLS